MGIAAVAVNGDTDSTTRPATAVEIVIPVTSRPRHLAPGVVRLHSYLTGAFPFPARVSIAAHPQVDCTRVIARELADTFADVCVAAAAPAARGPALRTLDTDCAVLAYVDLDACLDPSALVPLVTPLLAGDCDVSVAAGLRPGARPRRQVLSCGYTLLLQAGLDTGFAAAPWSMAAISREAARTLAPRAGASDWFFDRRLLALARDAGLRIREVHPHKAGNAA